MKTVVLLFSLVVATTLQADSAVELAERVDGLVQPYLDAGIFDAVSLGVVSGADHWTRHYGTLSGELDRPPNDDTIYELGSITKVFTGILLADAVVAGRVRLEQPIGELLPELQQQNPDLGSSIRLRNLAIHDSGLPRMPANFAPADPTNPYVDYDRQRMMDALLTFEPLRPPGAKFEYSNLAVGLLGQLLALQAGQSYEELLDQRILTPLKMSETGTSTDRSQQARLAPPHTVDRLADRNWDLNAFVGAGGIRSTTSDMLRFIRANLFPSDDAVGQAIELAWKQQAPASKESFAMGLGWHIARDGETRWHNGQTGGYHTMLLIDRRSDSGVILLCNTATGEVDALAESIIRVMAGATEQPRVFPAPVVIDPATVARLSGEYRISPTFALTVRAAGEKLYVRATNQPEARVYPESETQWRYRIVDAKLTFDLPAQGPATGIKLHQNGLRLPGQRVSMPAPAAK
jgi:CubicO group peptidase (beta-lactamase class C family)